jgi:hypothetical protein
MGDPATAFKALLENPASLISEIKKATKIIKSCKGNSKTPNSDVEILINNINLLISKGAPDDLATSNQRRYINNIISQIFDLETPINVEKVELLDQILTVCSNNEDASVLSVYLLMIDKLILYKDLVTNKNNTILLTFITDLNNKFNALVANKKFLIDYYNKSIFTGSSLKKMT